MVATKKNHLFILYFQRIASPDDAPRRLEFVTSFTQLRDSFGAIFAAWLAKREAFGAGFNLYLATRRGMDLYVQHRFGSLISGLEAFHRKKHGPKKSTKTQKRIEEIIGKLADRKDKKDLAGWLKHTPELNLEGRIFEALGEVPLDLDRDRLRCFANGCARDRNAISHFGEHQDRERTHAEFMLALHKKNEALSYLFHLLILHEIGLDDTILRGWVNNGINSSHIKWTLVQVGLLPADTMKPPASVSRPGA